MADLVASRRVAPVAGGHARELPAALVQQLADPVEPRRVGQGDQSRLVGVMLQAPRPDQLQQGLLALLVAAPPSSPTPLLCSLAENK